MKQKTLLFLFILLLLSYKEVVKAITIHVLPIMSWTGSLDDAEFNNIAKVNDITGENFVRKKQKDLWKPLLIGQKIERGDYIKTGFNSKLKLVCSDGSQIKLNENTRIEFLKDKKTAIKVIDGKIWGNINPKGNKLTVKTEGGDYFIKGTEFIISSTLRIYSTLTVIRGEVSFTNYLKTVNVKKNSFISVLKGFSNDDFKKISKDEIVNLTDWTDFGNPRIMVIIDERIKGKKSNLSIVESEINKSLGDAHYHLVDHDVIKYKEIIKTIEGVKSAEATGKKYNCDLLITGKVEAEELSKNPAGTYNLYIYKTFTDLRVIVVDTGQIILESNYTEKGAGTSGLIAGTEAIQKLSKKISDDLIWQLPQSYICKERVIEITAYNCNFKYRKELINYLKNLLGDNNVFPREFKNKTAFIDVKPSISSEELAKRLSDIKDIDITAIKANLIKIKMRGE